jgi:glycosyltransferase involved in cell wall biosynthesis
VKVAFLVNDLQLSGGIGVVVAHARQLAERHGHDVTLVLVREQELPHWEHEALAHLHVATLADARAAPVPFDVAVATWWETTSSLFLVPAERYAYFVQSLEDRFYHPADVEATYAGLTYDLPVAFVTEASWIAGTLRDLRPDASVHLVRNGIDKDVFPVADAVVPNVDGPLRVLVEGYANVWFKGVNAAIEAVRAMGEPHELTVVAPSRTGLEAEGATRVLDAVPQRELARLYGEHDVVLKLSSVEGMFGPPLEGFHQGATCVTTEVTGHEEYVEHGYNALVCDWDDPRGTARQLDLLAKDRVLLHRLRCGALETARRWPTWEQQGQVMAVALERIRREPPPDAAAAARVMVADLRGAMERQRTYMAERAQLQVLRDKVDRVKALPGVGEAVALRRTRRGRQALRVARAVARRARPVAARARSLPGRLRR